jgi:ribonuclease Z
MSSRELVVLGSASQVPTRHRNHNGYFLRWDHEGILFDPGEGTQRQMTFAGVSSSSITRICITHLHGDHCLGLPGIIQRLSLDRVNHPIDLFYPASGQEYIDRLRTASIFYDMTDIRCHPVSDDGVVLALPAFELVARRLDHGVDSIGYQLVEPDSRRMVPELLARFGVVGPRVSELQRAGHVSVNGVLVELADVSEPKPGQRFAFVMDTRVCANAALLGDRADLLVCESTFADADEQLAESYGHLTSTQAAAIARDAGARQLVITHFSQRYEDTSRLLAEAAAVFPNVIAAHDLLRVPVPPRVM